MAPIVFEDSAPKPPNTPASPFIAFETFCVAVVTLPSEECTWFEILSSNHPLTFSHISFELAILWYNYGHELHG